MIRQKIIIEDEIGKIYNNWKILSFEESRGTKKYFRCQCGCGRIKTVYHNDLKSGKSKQCTNCKSRTYVGKISGRYFYQIQDSAKNRNIHFDLTQQYLWDLYNNQNGKCALSNLPIGFAENRLEIPKGLQTASLDRIDSNQEYVVGNVQFLHKDINLIKWNSEQNYFINLCKMINNFNGKFIYKEFEILKMHQYWKGVGLISGSSINQIKQGAKKRNMVYDISNDYLWELFKTQGGVCALSGIDLYLSQSNKDLSNTTASLDRINSKIGYIENNLMWTHKKINVMRSDYELDYFKYLCKTVYEHQLLEGKTSD